MERVFAFSIQLCRWCIDSKHYLAFCLETLSRLNSRSACCNLAFKVEASLLAVDSLLQRAAWHLSSGLSLRPSCLYTQTNRRGWEAGAVQ